MVGVETPQDKGVKDGFSIHVLKDVAISCGFLASLRMTTRLRFPLSGVSWTIARHEDCAATKTRAPRNRRLCAEGSFNRRG